MQAEETPTSETPPAAKPKRRRRPILFRLLAVFIPILVVFIAGEIIVRVRYDVVDPRPYHWPGIYESADPPLRYDLQPNYSGVYHQQFSRLEVNTNELRMRDPELTPERRQAPRRVLILGDSIAFGRGVADDDTFTRHIERSWGPGVAAFNAGVPGYDTSQELEKLNILGPKIEPHLVILEWYRNDVLIPSHKVKAKVFDGHLANSEDDYLRWKSRYIDHTANPLDWSALIRFGRIQWKNFKLNSYKLNERSKKAWEVDEADMRLSQDAMREMKVWCDQRGVRFGVVMFPAREEVERDGVQPDYPKDVARFCREEGITFLDLRELWRAHWKETGETLYLPRDRCHPNAAGHAQVAEWIGDVFKDKVLAN